jgi:hypothetical protein
LSGLETGILRPIQLSEELPIISLSIAAEIGLSPDAVIVQSATRARTAVRRDTFHLRPPNDPALTRIVELLPSSEKARQALAGYKRTPLTGSINISDLDRRCGVAANRDAAECYWRTLADLILDDIDGITAVFRRSATLEDQYSTAEADALVRLGRHFVLLKLTDIEQAVTEKAKR